MSWLKCFIRKELEELVRILCRTTKMLRGLEIVKLCRKVGEKAEFFHLETDTLKTMNSSITLNIAVRSIKTDFPHGSLRNYEYLVTAEGFNVLGSSCQWSSPGQLSTGTACVWKLWHPCSWQVFKKQYDNLLPRDSCCRAEGWDRIDDACISFPIFYFWHWPVFADSMYMKSEVKYFPNIYLLQRMEYISLITHKPSEEGGTVFFRNTVCEVQSPPCKYTCLHEPWHWESRDIDPEGVSCWLV